MIKSASEIENLARSVDDNGGVYFVPAFAGLLAPHWRGDARGLLCGLTAYNTKAHIARAVLESTAFQVKSGGLFVMVFVVSHVCTAAFCLRLRCATPLVLSDGNDRGVVHPSPRFAGHRSDPARIGGVPPRARCCLRRERGPSYSTFTRSVKARRVGAA